MFIYSLWKDKNKVCVCRSSELQDIIDFVENHGIFIQDVDDLLDTDVMQEYIFEVERFTSFDENY